MIDWDRVLEIASYVLAAIVMLALIVAGGMLFATLLMLLGGLE